MAYQTGFVDNSVKLASHAFLDMLYTFATANGWTAVRDARTGDNPELILQGPGNLDYQDVFIGFRCYQDADLDYYNMEVAGFNGYVAEATFGNQPMPLTASSARFTTSVPLHNLQVDYWVCVNDLRITFVAKVGAPVYEPVYAGLYLPYAAPGQNTYPLFVGGMTWGAPAIRYSEPIWSYAGDTWVYDFPYRGGLYNAHLRSGDNQWLVPEIWPWQNTYFASTSVMRDSEDHYPLFPAVMSHSTHGVFGELDGIFYIPGFNNAVENTLVIDSVTYLVVQAISQTGFNDYFAMRLN